MCKLKEHFRNPPIWNTDHKKLLKELMEIINSFLYMFVLIKQQEGDEKHWVDNVQTDFKRFVVGDIEEQLMGNRKRRVFFWSQRNSR